MPAIAPYCVAQDIVDTLPRVLGRVTSINASLTVADITKVTRRISAEMDTRFGIAGYATPVDTSTSETIEENLSRISINGVCAQVLRSVYKTGDVNFELADTYERQYYSDIKRIEDSGFGEDVQETTSIADNIGSPQIGPPYDPIFTLKYGINPVNYDGLG